MSRVNFAGFLVLCIITLSLIIIFHYGFLSTASSDIGLNMPGNSSYSIAYNNSGNVTRAAFAVTGYVPQLLGGIAVLFAICLMLAIVLKHK